MTSDSIIATEFCAYTTLASFVFLIAVLTQTSLFLCTYALALELTQICVGNVLGSIANKALLRLAV